MVRGSVATGAEGYHGPVTDETARAAREADDATRGSAVKLAAEVASRLLGLATTLLLAARGLGASDFGALRRASGRTRCSSPSWASSGSRPWPRGRSWRARSRWSRSSGRASSAPPSWRRCARRPARSPAGPGWLREAVPVLAPARPRSSLLVGLGGVPGRGPALPRRASRRRPLLLLVLRGGGLVAAAVAPSLAGAGLVGVAWGARALAPSGPRPRGPGSLRAPAPRGRAAPTPASARGPAGVRPAGRARRAAAAEPARRVPRAVAAAAGDREAGALLRGAPRVLAPGDGAERRRRRARCPPSPARPSRAGRACAGGRRRPWRSSRRPAAIGLALVARAVVELLFGGRPTPRPRGAAAPPRRPALPAALPERAPVLGARWSAAGRAPGCRASPAARVAVAFALALVLVPPLGAAGAAARPRAAPSGCSSRSGCRGLPRGPRSRCRSLRPLGWALVACVPMALAVSGVSGEPRPRGARSAR